MKKFLLIFLFFSPIMLSAQVTINWNGDGDGINWEDGDNWDTDAIPVATDEVVISGSSADVAISSMAVAASIEIKSNATLIVNATGTLDLGSETGSTTNGALDLDTSGGIITNDGTINITDATDDGIVVKGTFTNNGTINILNFGDEGVSTATSTAPLFVNNGTLNVEANDGAGSEGLNIRGTGGVSTFENSATGIITILNSYNEGIVVTDGCTFNNSGSLTITNAGIPRGSGDNGIEVKNGIFNNLTGGTYKDVNCEGDALRTESSGVFNNSGTIEFEITSNTSDAIENKGTFNGLAGSVINIGCPGINEVEVNNGNLDLGSTTINFDILGTGSGGTDYDRFEIRNTVMDISGATANIVFDAGYTPTVGDCFKIVDGNSDGTGTVSGTFGDVTSSDPSVSFDVDYTDPTEVEICIADPCGAAAVGLSGSGTKTAAASCEDGDWTYYEDPSSPGAYMFAIEWDVAGNGSNAIAKASAIVTITLDAAIGSATAGTNGTWTMKRYWDVSSAALVDPVNVKFFYDQTEIDDVVGAQSTFGGTSEGFAWFKTVGTSFDPAMIDEYGVNQNAIVLADVSGGAMENGVLYAQFDGIESFSGGTGASGSGNGSSVLPIELASFTGKSMSRSNMLEWTTASEINTEFHIIERSSNGKDNWGQVGKVEARGNSNTLVSYSLEDTKPTAKSYYRLRSVDLDGYEGLSHVIYLERQIDRFEIIGTYPVPTMNSLSIDFETAIEQEVKIKMTDILGNEISQSVFAASAGTNTKTLDMSQLDSGVYFVTLYNGIESITKRVIKN